MTETQTLRMALREIRRLLKLHPGGMAAKIQAVADKALAWEPEPPALPAHNPQGDKP